MSEYTPTTEQVRWQYTREEPPRVGTASEKTAEFNRWLAGVKAEAWDEGYNDGRRQGAEGDDGPRFTNPYRERGEVA